MKNENNNAEIIRNLYQKVIAAEEIDSLIEDLTSTLSYMEEGRVSRRIESTVKVPVPAFMAEKITRNTLSYFVNLKKDLIEEISSVRFVLK